jgi:acyl-CoA thioesterase FadM
MIWAALDCPTIWAAWATSVPAAIPSGSFTVLARQRLEQLAPVPAGEPLIVTAWPISAEGRKHVTAAAIHDRDGELLARAESLLVDVPRDTG